MAAPEAKVTMIGATGSGKTTYLLGMYANMSAGFQGYTLVTKNLDDDLDMSDDWNDLCDHGVVPDPGGTDRKMYSFIFRQRGQTLLNFDWEDYRGGAMRDKASDPNATDVAPLYERMVRSDSIYLVLNGTHLTGATPAPGELPIYRNTLSTRMNAFLNHALVTREERGIPAPSIVVMVTKADMIRQANPASLPKDLMDMICDKALELLPDCFQEGIHTLVCPVQIGDFGMDNADRTSKVDPLKVNTRNLPYPLIHSFLNLLDSYTQGLRGNTQRLEGDIAQSAEDLAAFEKSWGGIFQPGKVRSRKVQIQESERRLRELQEVLSKSDSQVARLAADLEQAMLQDRVAVFEDGERLG